MISLAQLCGQLGADLQPCAIGPVPRRQLSGVHISELADPTPYLSGGELLLTTGIPLAGGDAEVRAYVGRLAGHGLSALGVGLGAGLDQLPPELGPACAATGLPLLVVPDGTPFLNVSRAYWDLVVRQGQAEFAANLGTQAALARAATLPDALASVVKMLAGVLEGWVVYLPAVPGPATVWPRSAAARVPELRAEVGRLTMTGAPSAATFALDGAEVIQYPITVGRQVTGFLAIGAGRKMTKADRHIVLTVCVLLSLRTQQDQEATRSAAVLRASVTRLILAGHTEAAGSLAGDLEVASLPERARLLVLHIPGDPSASVTAEELARTLEERGRNRPGWAVGLRRTELQAWRDGVSYLVLDAGPGLGGGGPDAGGAGAGGAGAGGPDAGGAGAGDGASDGAAGAGTYRGGDGADAVETDPALAGAISRALPLARIAAVVEETLQAAAAAAPGRIVAVGSERPDPGGQWVAALREYSRADLVGAVRAYLRHRGHWEQAARSLGVHRNSLRHRIGIAAKVLGTDLDDPDVAAQLWLALRARESPRSDPEGRHVPFQSG